MISLCLTLTAILAGAIAYITRKQSRTIEELQRDVALLKVDNAQLDKQLQHTCDEWTTIFTNVEKSWDVKSTQIADDVAAQVAITKQIPRSRR